MPPPLERLVLRCVEKRPEDRFQSARDVAFGLEALSGASGAGAVAVSEAGRARRRRPALIALAGAALFGLGWLAAAAIRPARPTAREPRPVTRLTLPIPAEAPLGLNGNWNTQFAIAPDGSAVAYVAQEKDGSRLYLRRLSRDQATNLPGTEDAVHPFFELGHLRLSMDVSRRQQTGRGNRGTD